VARNVSIGLGQVTGEPYAVGRNLRITTEAADALFERGADIVVLPELVASGYVADRERLRAVAESLDGPTVSAWADVAGRHGGWVVGGMCERDGDALYNTALLVGGDGVRLHYRKLHLFREEKLAFAPGDLGLPVAELPFGRVGICICYDLRFIETVRILSLQGAELVCVPTAWLVGFDRQKWDERGLAPQALGAILQANLDQVFIACASQADHRYGLDLLGSSILADPRGRLLVGPLPGDTDELAVETVDLDDVERAQTRDPLITPRADRRTDVYGLAVEGGVI
jgi:N-carbamoylputrescine amidase